MYPGVCQASCSDGSLFGKWKPREESKEYLRKRWISNKQELTPKLHLEQCCHSLHICFGHSLRDCYRMCDLFVKARFNATLPHPITATVDIAAPPQRTLRNWKTLNTWNWLPEWNLTSTQHRQSTGMEGGKIPELSNLLNLSGRHSPENLGKAETFFRQLHRFRRSFWIPRVENCTPAWTVGCLRGGHTPLKFGVVRHKEPDKSSSIGLVWGVWMLLIQGRSKRCTKNSPKDSRFGRWFRTSCSFRH